MLLIDKLAPRTAIPTEKLIMPFEQRCKTRLRCKLETGEVIGLFLERGTSLRKGDLLEASDGRIVQIEAAPEPLMQVCSEDNLLLARAAYHLGNRHVAVELQLGLLRFGCDHVLGEMIKGLGLIVEKTIMPFEPESGAYGGQGGHKHHGTDTEGRGPVIHDMSRRSSS